MSDLDTTEPKHRGVDILRDPRLNKMTCFSEEEREALGLVGLVPEGIEIGNNFMARCRGDQAAVPGAVAKEQGEQTKVVVREGHRERSYFMKKPGLLVAAAAVIVLLGGVAAMQWFGANEWAAAQAPRTAQPRAVSVEVGAASKKKMPVIIEGDLAASVAMSGSSGNDCATRCIASAYFRSSSGRSPGSA